MAYLKHSGCVYIGGEWQQTDASEAVINPADETLLIDAPVGSAAQVDAAIASPLRWRRSAAIRHRCRHSRSV